MLSDDELLEDIKLSADDVKPPLKMDDWVAINYSIIRHAFELQLIDQWYPSHLVDEVDDWREEFKIEEYNIYLENY